MSTDFKYLSKSELLNICQERNIKTAKSYTKEQIIDLLNGKELVKPFKCDFKGCDYAFTTSGNLATHKLTHTGEKPYKCDFKGCDYAFTTSGNLATHKLKHSGDKPYKCDFKGCDYATTQSGNLATHNRIHTGEKPFKCDFKGCDYATTQSSALATHKKAMHSEEGQRRQKKSEHFTFSYLEKHMDIKREHQVNFNCNGGTFCRLDGLSLHKNKKGQGFIIAHENDENQHEGYMISCETRRMTEVRSVFTQDGNEMSLIFIRYNPDAFRVDGELQKIKKKDRLKRYVELVRELENSEEEMMPLTIYYLYYDTNGDKLEIFYDADYPKELKGNVKIIY